MPVSAAKEHLPAIVKSGESAIMKIWQDEKYRGLQGTYPVISLSFANIKEREYATARKKICQIFIIRGQ